jgi:predicted nucleotidyltransferase
MVFKANYFDTAISYGINESDIGKIKTVFEQFLQIDQVILYGSRAKGNFKNGSDIDLTLIGNGLNLKTLNKIDLALDDLLLPYIFDISIHKQIKNKELLEHISRVGKILFQKTSSEI